MGRLYLWRDEAAFSFVRPLLRAARAMIAARTNGIAVICGNLFYPG
jgi:hypothetical protein